PKSSSPLLAPRRKANRCRSAQRVPVLQAGWPMKAAKLSARVCLRLPDSHPVRKVGVSEISAASAGSRVMPAWWSAPSGVGGGGSGFGVLDEPVEQGGLVGLAVVAGVVALADQDGQELGAGAEVGAGLAGGLQTAVQLRWSCAQPVAEHPGVGFAAQPGHAGALVVGGQLRGLAVERVDLGA